MTIRLRRHEPWTCQQCGRFVAEMREGVCVDCCAENQARLDMHIAAFDAWEKLTDAERDQKIKIAAQSVP